MLVVLVVDTSPSMAMAPFALKQHDRYNQAIHQRAAYWPADTRSGMRRKSELEHWTPRPLLFPSKLLDVAPGSAGAARAQNRLDTQQNPFKSSFTCLHAAIYACELFLEKCQKRAAKENRRLRVTLWTTSSGMVLPVTDKVRQCEEALRWIASPANIKHLQQSGGDKSTCHTGPLSWGQLLAQMFEYLHLFRMSHHFDTPGHGWYPQLSESTAILCLTDGGPLFAAGAAADASPPNTALQLCPKLEVPGLQVPGSGYYFTPFRWDQRMFTMIFNDIASKDRLFAASRTSALRTAARRDLEGMSREMNGVVFEVAAEADIKACIAELVGIDVRVGSRVVRDLHPATKCLFPSGVSVLFTARYSAAESSAEDKVPPARPELCLLVVERPAASRGHKIGNPLDRQTVDEWGLYPIPVADHAAVKRADAEKFPPQFPFPNIYVAASMNSSLSKDWQRITISAQLAAKKYLIPSTYMICARLLSMPLGTCWMCYANEADMANNRPFGFIRSGSRRDVVLWVLPYNFPYLCRLLETFKRFNDGKPSMEWFDDLTKYLSSLPAYYHWPVKRALENVKSRSGRTGLPLPASFDSVFMGKVQKAAVDHLHRAMRDAKTEIQARDTLATSNSSAVTSPSEAALVTLNTTKSRPTNVFDIDRNDLLATWELLSGTEGPLLRISLQPAAKSFEGLIAQSFGSCLNRLFAPRTDAQREVDKSPEHNTMIKTMTDASARMVERRFPTIEAQLFDSYVKRKHNPYIIYPYATMQQEMKKFNELTTIHEMVTEDRIDDSDEEEDIFVSENGDNISQNNSDTESDSSSNSSGFKRLADCPPLSDDDSTSSFEPYLVQRAALVLSDKAPTKAVNPPQPLRNRLASAYPLSTERRSESVPVLVSLAQAPFNAAMLSPSSAREMVRGATFSFLRALQREEQPVKSVVESAPSTVEPDPMLESNPGSKRPPSVNDSMEEETAKRTRTQQQPPPAVTEDQAEEIPLRHTVEQDAMKELLAIVKKRGTVQPGSLTEKIRQLHLTDIAERKLASELGMQAKRFRKNALAAEMESLANGT